MSNLSQKVATVTEIRQIPQVKRVVASVAGAYNDAQNPLMNISSGASDIKNVLTKSNDFLKDPIGTLKGFVDDTVDGLKNDMFNKNVSTGILTDVLNRTDEPMLKTHTVSFFTTPADSVIKYIQNNFSFNDVVDLANSARSMRNLDDLIDTLGKVEKVSKSLIKKDLISGNFLSTLNRQNRGVTTQKLSFNIESTIGNLQHQRNMQPTISSGFSGGTFSATFIELDDLSVTRIILLWFLYMKAVNEGSYEPDLQNILDNIVDYKTSVYVFHLKPNLSEILFFSKYTGVFPTAVPVDVFSSDKDTMSDTRLEVEFSYDLYEPLNPKIIDEFNSLVRSGTDIITPSATVDGAFEFTKRYT